MLSLETARRRGRESRRANCRRISRRRNSRRIGTDRVGAVVGKELLKQALWAVVASLVAIMIYVAFRFGEFSYGLGALVSLLHDVLMTIGWFCLTGRTFSMPVVAAVLTLIGYSINDTIVIFDRIRENKKLTGGRLNYFDLINRSVNETLSRTILTAGTVFLCAVALYGFGGRVINDFAFCFMVGVLTGTYSSIYIASPCVLWWHRGEGTKARAVVKKPEPAKALEHNRREQALGHCLARTSAAANAGARTSPCQTTGRQVLIIAAIAMSTAHGHSSTRNSGNSATRSTCRTWSRPSNACWPPSPRSNASSFTATTTWTASRSSALLYAGLERGRRKRREFPAAPHGRRLRPEPGRPRALPEGARPGLLIAVDCGTSSREEIAESEDGAASMSSSSTTTNRPRTCRSAWPS